MGGGEGEGIKKIGIDTYTLLCLKQITNKDLLYSTGNSTQYFAMAYMGKESKKEWIIYVYVYVCVCICICVYVCVCIQASLMSQTVKNLPAMWETWVQSSDQEDCLEK